MNYTKGEWKVREYDEGTRPFIDGFSLAVQSPKLVVALCDKDSWDNKKQRLANANLIAAAPDMYEALKELIWVLGEQGDELAHANIAYVKEWNLGKQALAKAEGRE